MHLSVHNETSQLRNVVVGIGIDPGPPRGINAKSREAIRRGTYPRDSELGRETDDFARALLKCGVEVLRPSSLPGLNQIFTRDLGVVIGPIFIQARMKYPVRQAELSGLASSTKHFRKSATIKPPNDVFIEGGDVVLWDDTIFVGTGQRTNKEAVSWLRKLLPHYEIIEVPLVHKSSNPRVSILHLDCTFQPVGEGCGIVYPAGIAKRSRDRIMAYIRKRCVNGLFRVTSEEMYEMYTNIFSVSPKLVISCPTFGRLNKWLRSKGIEVISIPYQRTSVLGGLLRCSTLPLRRG